MNRTPTARCATPTGSTTSTRTCGSRSPASRGCGSAATSSGRSPTTSSGRPAGRSGSASSTSTGTPSSARRRTPTGGSAASSTRVGRLGLYDDGMEILIVVGIIVLLVVVVGIYLWSTYNGLVRLNVRVDEAWSDITVQLKRRADLIPNLIEAVKGYAAHEKGVFEAVTKARAESLTAGTPGEAAVAENHMQAALKSIF